MFLLRIALNFPFRKGETDLLPSCPLGVRRLKKGRPGGIYNGDITSSESEPIFKNRYKPISGFDKKIKPLNNIRDLYWKRENRFNEKKW
jgi:hypothetical protein